MPARLKLPKRRRGRPSKTTHVREDDVAIMSRRASKSKRRKAQTGWSFEWQDEDDWAPYISADWILAEVSEAVHALHVEAIENGERADTGELQPPLDPFGTQGRMAKKGDRPKHRAVTGKSPGRSVADLLTRTPIKTREHVNIGGKAEIKGTGRKTVRIGTAASCEIKPGNAKHDRFMARELEYEGVEYLFVEGRIEKAIDQALNVVIDKALLSPPSKRDAPELGKIEGRDLK